MPSAKTLEHKQVLGRAAHDVITGPHQAGFMVSRLNELGEHQGCLGIDTETTGLDPRVNRVRLIQIGTPDYALIIDLNGWRWNEERQVDWSARGLKQLKALLESDKTKVLQNAAFDLNFLRGEGVVLGGPLLDTMIAAKLINNGTGAKNDLGSIVERNLKVELPKELQRADWSGPITPEMFEYAARDVICLPRVIQVLVSSLHGSVNSKGQRLFDVFRLEMKVLRPIATMQWYGFKFDKQGAQKLHEELQLKSEQLKLEFLESLDRQLRALHPENPRMWLPRDADNTFNTREKDSGSIRKGTKLYKGFNPRSSQQMAERFTQAGIRLAPNISGKPSLDQNLLAFIRKEYTLVDQYLTWKQKATEVSNIEKLLDSIGGDGRIHCHYRQMGTETGRLSAAEPNLQQVNRSADFRSKFIAEAGCVLLVADFSQIELRVAAELSGEERMIAAYNAGRDLHTETAALMTGVALDAVTKSARTSAKVANFGLLYGAGPATLRKQAVAQYGIDMAEKEASNIVDGFRSAYPTLYAWQTEEGNMTTKSVYTAFGRRRILSKFSDKYTTRINTQVQGTAGDIAKLAISLLWKSIIKAPMDEAKLIAMVHDEIVLEVKEDTIDKWSHILQEAMEGAGRLICKTVPIVAEVSHGKTWADAK